MRLLSRHGVVVAASVLVRLITRGRITVEVLAEK
jgi:hypothetical protein